MKVDGYVFHPSGSATLLHDLFARNRLDSSICLVKVEYAKLRHTTPMTVSPD